MLADFHRRKALLVSIAPLLATLLIGGCGNDESSDFEESSRVAAKSSESPQADALPTASYRREFTRQAESMPAGHLQDLAREYAWNLYDQEEVVATIVNRRGQAVDCLDMARQPALRREDGTYESIRHGAPSEEDGARAEIASASKVGISGQNCPIDTVERVRAEASTFGKYVTSRSRPPNGGKVMPLGSGPERPEPLMWYGSPPYQVGSGGYEHARATQTIDNQGMSASLSVYRPRVEAAGEHTVTQLWLMGQNATDCANPNLGYGTCQSVEVGVLSTNDTYPSEPVNPDPTFVIYSTADNYGNQGQDCFVDNSGYTCPTFVMTAQSTNPIYPDHSVPYSADNSTNPAAQEIAMKIRRTAPYWYVYANGVEIGYFVNTYFHCEGQLCDYAYPWFTTNGLLNRSNLIRYGGEVINLNPNSGHHTNTEMGSGAWGNAASVGTHPAAYQHELLVYPNPPTSDGIRPTLDVTSTSNFNATPPIVDNDYNRPACYSLFNTGTPWPGWKSQAYIFFGGNGWANGAETNCP